ncbi:hypothetical protein AB4Y85_05480 [Microvirga sp. 2YAF29]|uniref:hypothetical protein n=1 Tax=Microvirga sp. 2YAF29 TaxID=3233031 RepID=UPI003F977E68
MSIDRAYVAVEAMIADHVAVSFQRNAALEIETTASQIRNRITDRFERTKPGSEQDNRPPALTELRNNIIEIFGPVREEPISHERTEALEGLQQSLERLRNTSMRIAFQGNNPLHMQFLLERQQLTLKNEVTEGFGRVEIWLVSIAALGLVLLNAIDFVWSLPILALGIGRSCFLDRRCKKRHARIAEIDALIGVDSMDGD